MELKLSHHLSGMKFQPASGTWQHSDRSQFRPQSTQFDPAQPRRLRLAKKHPLNCHLEALSLQLALHRAASSDPRTRACSAHLLVAVLLMRSLFLFRSLEWDTPAPTASNSGPLGQYFVHVFEWCCAGSPITCRAVRACRSVPYLRAVRPSWRSPAPPCF